MVNAVVVPEWLKKMPMAPEFYPTETEFADPIAYISKIEKEASAFGICKIIPPIPKPSKKFVFSNLNTSLLKRPEIGSDVNFRGLSKSGGGDEVEEVRAVFTTRQQEVGYCAKRTRGMGNVAQPPAKKQVWQSGEVYTLEQFEAKAKAFSRDVLGKIEEVSPLVVETLFWKAASEKPIYVEYANDVPGSAFSEPIGPVRRIRAHKARGRRRVFTQNSCVRSGDEHKAVRAANGSVDVEIDASTQDGPNTTLESGNMSSDSLTSLPDQGSETSRQKAIPHNHGRETAGCKLSNSPWNLQVISRSAGSLTRFMLDDIPGVTSPMIYIGMLFSWFAWHVEDHELHSLNYLHIGSPKTWYAVPGERGFAFEEVIHNETYVDNKDTLAALAFLGEKTTIVSPEVVTRRGIPCCRLVQNPGEFVVTFPRAYHIGFSHGFNCGEAANFATPQWLNVAKEAAVRRTIMDHLPMLSHQQLLYHLTMSFVSRIPISLLPGIRSSRLRNRQKEARELLVKRAFIEDVLESNNLVNDLLKKDSSFRAVFWNSNALLPFVGESITETKITTDAAKSENDRPAICLNNDNDRINLYEEITLHMQMMDDLDIIDLSGDFEISSGTLPCVACGILGFPYMCVVQPSNKASREILLANWPYVQGENEASQSRKPKPTNISNDSFSAKVVEVNERWNSSCGFLRPRIFCLEHAVQAEELLQSKGGANVLVICHSDFQKIKPTASMIAEEIGFAFGYKEVNLDFASVQDLSLINLAIDDGLNEDWTSNLGINLKHFVKARNKSVAKPLEHKFKLCGLFPDAPILDMSKIRWSCRKSRRKRKRTCQDHAKSGGILHEMKDEAGQTKEENLKSFVLVDAKRDNDVPVGNPASCMPRKVNVCFQYTRRKYKSKSGEVVGIRSGVDSLIKHPQDALNNGGTYVDEHINRSETLRSGVERCTLTDNEYQQPSGETAGGIISSQFRNCTDSKAEVDGVAQTNEISEVSYVENSCLSAIISSEHAIDRWKHMEDGDNLRDEVKNMLQQDKIFEGLDSGANKEDVAKDNISDDTDHTVLSVAETASKLRPDKIPLEIKVSDCNAVEITHENDKHEKDGDLANSNPENVVLAATTSGAHAPECPKKDHETDSLHEVSDCKAVEITHENEGHEKDGDLANSNPENVVLAATTSVAHAPECPKKDHETDSLHLGILASACLANEQSEKIDAGARNRKRGRRDPVLLDCNLNHDGFVKSPCEGLRPRIRKEEFNVQTGRNTAKEAEEAPPKKKKKAVEFSPSGNGQVVKMTPNGTYRCDLDQCQMEFRTKTELSRHKQNICSREGCGKKFSSHSKFVNHLSVHDKQQSFQCTWKGCKMDFNSESARTEHMKTHMGARPYQCELEDCGLAFRYLSEFNRHRRRTGHGMDSAPAV